MEADKDHTAPNGASNPLEPAALLSPKGSSATDVLDRIVHPAKTPNPEDSALTQAEKHERHGGEAEFDESPAKRVKLEPHPEAETPTRSERVKGVAPIKAEFLVHVPGSKGDRGAAVADDDAAEGVAHQDGSKNDRGKKKGKSQGQNYSRNFGHSQDEVGLCSSRAHSAEFSPDECQFGDRCKFEHDLRKYLKEWKREDLTTFDGVCPTWSARGKCDVGWKCRFVGSHMQERDTEDGGKELVLVEDEGKASHGDPDGTINEVSYEAKLDLAKRKTKTDKAEKFNEWLENYGKEVERRRGKQGP